MKKLSLLLLILVVTLSDSFGQERTKTGIDIKNSFLDLKKNKVSAIVYTDYYYKDKRKKQLADKGRKRRTEIFDSLGRNTEVIYYDSLGLISGRSKYYHTDSTGFSMYRIEYYNRNDSLEKVNVAEMRDGKMLFLRVNSGSWCFGNYKFKYNRNGLIEEAIWYGPKDGTWADDDMIPYYVTKLAYSYFE